MALFFQKRIFGHYNLATTSNVRKFTHSINPEKREVMKRFLMVAVLGLFAFTMGAYAQKGEKALGVHLNYATEVDNAGLGAFFMYNFTDALRGEVAGDYYFKRDHLSMCDLNLTLHYLFPVGDYVKLYPLAGLTYTNWKAFNEHASRVGGNFGGGAQFDVADNFSINLEIKYQLVADFDQAVFSLGGAYRF